MGVVFAGLIVAGWSGSIALRTPADGGWLEALLTVVPFAALMALLARAAQRGAAA
jgi:hypothetical protein